MASDMPTTPLSRIEQLETEFKEASLTGSQTTALFFDLGWAYHQSYTESHHRDALESAVRYYKDGLAHEPVDEDCQGNLLINLGNILIISFERFGEMEALVEAISYHGQALTLHPPDHPNRTLSLNGLANALDARFCQLGDMKDLENVIIYREQGLALSPSGHPHRSHFLNNLANALSTRFQQLGDRTDLEKAISWHQEALELRPPGHPNRSSSLMNLANILKTRFQQLGSMKDLDGAIVFYQEALESYAPGNYDRFPSLMNLGNALQARFQQLGSMADLDGTISCHEQALELQPPGHSDRHVSLTHLGNALKIRFEQLGETKDLQAAITLHKEGLELCPPGHPTRYILLVNLANTYMTKFDQTGTTKDLEEAITWYEQAVSLCPLGHPGRSMSLMNLGNGLSSKFQLLGDMAYLDEAINCLDQALDLCPPGHNSRLKHLNNLANALMLRFWKLGRIGDLDKAIICHQQVLSMFLLQGHPEKPACLNNLAAALRARGEHLGQLKDLEEAIIYDKQALELHPPGHSNRFLSQSGLASTFLARFKFTEDLFDLKSASDGYQSTLSCLSPHHPFCSSVFTAQASVAIAMHDSAQVVCNGCSHIDEACRLYELAAHHATSSMYNRFIAAKQWAKAAHKYQHTSAISAYSTALDLQQQHLALFPSILSQQKLMKNSTMLSLNAAACAISNDMPEIAVQLLEQGRSILWSKIQGYRQPFEELSKKDPELANEIRAVAHQLEHNATSAATDINLQHTVALAEKWESLLEKVRKLEGYSGYLQAVPFSILQYATSEGPVIMVNISDLQSDAIILMMGMPPIVVPLQGASPRELELLVEKLSKVTTGARPSRDIAMILQYLWNAIVEPVVNQLAWLRVPEKSHIWWCPTLYLCALPLHAAGPYKKGHKNLSDIYISSYTPNLVSLIRSRSLTAKPQPTLNMLIVSHPDDTIPQVLEETKVINSFGKKIDVCSGQDATKDAVLSGLQSHSWVHFACHGHLEEQPFNSWFQLHNGEHLTVLDLAKAQIPKAEFAFLSACHSAAGNIYGTPDESIHLAAALQFCGFRSVIGTLWAMVDDDGPAMADGFYNHMFGNSDTVNFRDAARALNIATRELRRQGVPLDHWINFIHIGA